METERHLPCDTLRKGLHPRPSQWSAAEDTAPPGEIIMSTDLQQCCL